jgi:predicted dinucleotide-binding enzyme
MKVTIFGKGNMGQAIGKNFELAGNQVEYFGNGDKAEKLATCQPRFFWPVMTRKLRGPSRKL